MSINIPNSAADEIEEVKSENKIIINPFHTREVLTTAEAIDCINLLSGALLAHERSFCQK